MKNIIVIAGQRFITFLVAFGLLNPSAANLSVGADTTPSAGVTYITPGQDWTNLPATEPAAAHDNQVEWDGLGHDSRDTLYRTPAGPVATGTSVTLRLRAASGDLTAAQVRIFNDRMNTLSVLDMSLVVEDGAYEWWQVTLQPSTLPSVYWYRFIAIDGADVDYFADDNDLLGGLGFPSEEEVDNCWQLTFYDPNFQTPDWVQNGIIYQIFPDRFRDGDTGNNTLPTFYYGEEDSAIFRSGTPYWNEEICDPLNEDWPCPGIYGENFYGGDLQGVINKLDYLDQLGVTAIYFNPIFRSPSNHGYDTINYQVIDSSLGDNTLFTSLISQAAARGMFVILDGVFNYTSSDSVYFDRYQRYSSGLGACEAISSYYRDWYFFYDVAPGTGPCIGSDGSANGGDYISLAGDDKLPLLDSTNREVQEQFWKDDENPNTIEIAPWYSAVTGVNGWWLDSGAEVDPGVLSNAANLYWEGFRDAVHAVQPTAYIVGEERGNGTSWTLGSEWDASTNYQFSTAVLGFWRDEPFTDNDHYPGSVAGVIEPLLPSQLNERLLNMRERYAPEALAAMMNLLDSHNTNRALFMLDHNTDQNNTSLYRNPSYNWSDAITRLKGTVLLQMTLPGSPTIYYGDEVGLVGPVTFDTSANTWLDDPYNRMPFPWLDQSTLPYYTHLQSSVTQNNLLNYYKLLINTRNAHPALRTGSFDPLLVDDPNMIYAYGRRLLYPADAAVVVHNRSAQAQSVTLDLSGYLPATLSLVDILHNNAVYTIASDGSLTLNNIPAMSGLLLVYTSGDLEQPAAPLNLVAVEGESQITLTWNAVPDTSYQIFRSLLTGGGYELLEDSITSTEYTDTTVINGRQYYYVVRSVKPLGVVSEFSSEATALPHWTIDEANLQSPAEITHTIGLTATQPVYGQIFIDEVTAVPGAAPGILAQVGYGSAGIPPSDWSTWLDASFDSDQESRDQFASPLLPESAGDFQVVYRYSTNHGLDWTYADLDGIFTGTPSNPSILHVLTSDDITPPATPGNLRLVDWGDHSITMSWDPSPDEPTLYAYDIYRSIELSSNGVPVARVPSSSTTYTDTQVISGTSYYYRVQAIDTSFNRSALSNQITGSTTSRQITVTFTVVVPDFTYGTVFIVGDHPKLGSWDPSKIPMTKMGESTWAITLTFEEGVQLAYKFTRGNYAWLDIETAADGNTEIPNRTLSVEADSTGTIVVNTTVANWRDPLIAHSYPSDRATEVPINPVITLTWNQAMEPDTVFTLSLLTSPITGTVSYNPSTWTVSFTPTEYLQVDTLYTLTAAYQTDVVGDPQLVQYSWTFTTIEAITIHTVALPIVRKN